MFVGVGLFFIGLPSPVLWGLLAALLRFVPYVGSLTAAVLPIALAAAVDPGWSIALWTAGLFIVAEGVTGQVLGARALDASSTGLSPTAVIVVAIFWSWIWVPIGLILSTPITLCLVVGRHVRHLEFFDVLLGDRPALTPIEVLYQRLLAGDPDEILEQAETLLKGRALSSYYDDIALKALRLVGSDISRGVVQDAQLEKIREEMLGLIQDLEPHDDLDPVLTNKQAKAAVVEVAGVARPERETSSEPARRKNMSTRTCIYPKSGAPNEACFASQAAAPSTASRRRCWRSCCASMGWARKRRLVTRRPGRGSAGSTPPVSQWCASPTSSLSAARRICATFCAESNNDFRSPRS